MTPANAWWTPERAEEAAALLRRETRLQGSLERVAEVLTSRHGRPISRSALQKGLAAAGYRAMHLVGQDRTREPVVAPPQAPPSRIVPPTWDNVDKPPAVEDFSVAHPPASIDTSELVARRKDQFARLRQVEKESALIAVRVNLSGPIGILHFGDPHVDDNGTDIAALERHTELVRTTQGLFAGNVGDTTNNWVGRLARLYGDQSTSAAEAWALAEWFVGRCRWLYMVAGNHDCWSGAGDPLKWMARQAGALHMETAVRLGLKFPNGREVRVNIRHDFAGHSQWNPAHGAMKAAQYGVRDHVLVNGHKHVSGYGLIKDGQTGTIAHCIQVASYKLFDRYAREKGFRDQSISPCAVTVIDPDATSEPGLVQVFWDPELAADFLTYLRRKRAA